MMTGTIPGNDGEQSARDGRDDAEWILKIKFIQGRRPGLCSRLRAVIGPSDEAVKENR